MLNSYKFTIFAIFVIGLMIFGIIKEYPKRIEVSERLENLEAKVTDLKTKNEELERQAQYFKSDAFLEKEARLKFNLRKPGEELVIIEKKENTEETDSEIEEGKKEYDTFAESIKFFFADIKKLIKF